MTNNKQQTAVDAIIEFCQKQMDNDSSIHKGVYLSIIKFCKEQITEESEIHWKTTLVTMTNNKQQTAVEWFHIKTWALKIQLEKGEISIGEYANTYATLYEQAKEMEKERIETAYNKGIVHGIDYPESTLPITGEQYYNETYGGGEQ